VDVKAEGAAVISQEIAEGETVSIQLS